MSTSNPTPTGQTDHVNPWAVLAVLCTSIFMLLLDTTIVNNAQRKIQIGLGAELSEIQWILDAYILTYAVLLLSFGRMGDIFGRKRFFIAGIVVFTAASGLCGVSGQVSDLVGVPGADALIAARALQGFGAAMMMPQSLSIITQVFPAESRGTALGVWGSVVALGAITGPLIGGFIATNYPWEWVFLINVPVGIAGVVASLRILPETFDPDASRRLDWGGVVFSGSSIFLLVFALIEGNTFGWTSPEIIALLAGAGVLFMVFLWWERRQAEPMVRLELFRIHNFAITNAMLVLIAFGAFGIFFPLTLFLQAGVGYTPLEAGLVTVPMSLMHMIASPLSGRLSDRYGPKRFLVTGMGLLATGIALIAWQTSPQTTWMSLLVPTMITGTGIGMVMSPLTSTAMREVPRGIAGSASGIINTTRSVGQVLGIAVLGTVLQARMARETDDRLDRVEIDSSLQADLVNMAEASQFEQIVDRLQAVPDLLPVVMPLIQRSFADAVRFSFVTSAAIVTIGLMVALRLREPHVKRVAAEAPARPASNRSAEATGGK